MSKGRVLVTGAAGFIGSHITEFLVAEGYEVVGLDNFHTGREENLARVRDRIELVIGDICDRDKVLEVVDGVDYIVHHAALTSVRESVHKPAEYNRVNIDGTVNMLEAARSAGVKRFVFASSSSVYGEATSFPEKETDLPAPESPYALTKLAGEHYCRIYHNLFGVKTIAFRYFNVYGPRQDPDSPYAAVIPIFSALLAKGRRPTIFGTGEQCRDFVHVRDVCRANLAALDAPEDACGGVYNIASGTTISVNELFGRIRSIAGKEDIDPEYGPAQPGDVFKTVGSIDLAAAKLGFSPSVSLEEGLEETVRFFLEKEGA